MSCSCWIVFISSKFHLKKYAHTHAYILSIFQLRNVFYVNVSLKRFILCFLQLSRLACIFVLIHLHNSFHILANEMTKFPSKKIKHWKKILVAYLGQYFDNLPRIIQIYLYIYNYNLVVYTNVGNMNLDVLYIYTIYKINRYKYRTIPTQTTQNPTQTTQIHSIACYVMVFAYCLMVFTCCSCYLPVA